MHGDLYGADILVQLLEFRRPEMKFDGVEALKAQLAQDIDAGETILSLMMRMPYKNSPKPPAMERMIAGFICI